jgi:hypothetical protein
MYKEGSDIMASALIHIAVAHEIDKVLDIKNKRDYYLGSIAPDLAKQIGETKKKSHFLENPKTDLPNIDKFINKYPNFKNVAFDLGYFIHLYTDKIWFSSFINKITNNNYLKLLDGTIIEKKENEPFDIIYQDYTNLNIKVIEEYNLDLSLFYEEFREPITSIDEIPIDKLDILIDKMGVIIENSKNEKTYSLEIDSIKDFIEDSTNQILEELKKY